MACFHPLKAYKSASIGENGKRLIVFNHRNGYNDLPVDLPCGQCIGCRLERSRQWAMRMCHEAHLYDQNCFITLTYSNENLPKLGSLCKRDFQLFMKRLRKYYNKSRIRFFHCGEYGEKLGRPHYHAILFNFDFPDKTLHKISGGSRLYVSPKLDELWGKGHCMIGDVTFESAAYVARYVVKKVTGDRSDEHYQVVDGETGELLGRREPEYTTMSRRPGIGMGWFEKYSGDVYPDDFVVVREKKMKPPKYYDGLLEKMNVEKFALIKGRRRCRAFDNKENNTCERLKDREKIQKARLSQRKRGYEDGL